MIQIEAHKTENGFAVKLNDSSALKRMFFPRIHAFAVIFQFGVLSLSTFNRDKSLSRVFLYLFHHFSVCLYVCLCFSALIFAFIYSKLFVYVFLFLLVASVLFFVDIYSLFHLANIKRVLQRQSSIIEGPAFDSFVVFFSSSIDVKSA